MSASSRARLRHSRRALNRTNPLGDAVETFIRREDAERFIEEARGNDAELASYLRIEERELEGRRVELKARGVQEARPSLLNNQPVDLKA
jgi:hypothetical protein